MELFIIPVAHVSRESVKRVREAIKKEKPDVVAVELDVERFQAMAENRKPGIRELLARPFAAVFYLIQQAFGKIFNVVPGSEMLEAVYAAQDLKIPVAFVDRPVGLTIQRLSAIPFSEKLFIATQALIAPLAFMPNPFSHAPRLTPEMLAQELPEEFMEEFRRKLPNAYRVLIDERDHYMFRQVERLGAERVLLVVGAGHMRGIRRLVETNIRAPPAGFAS